MCTVIETLKLCHYLGIFPVSHDESSQTASHHDDNEKESIGCDGVFTMTNSVHKGPKTCLNTKF